MYATLTAIIVNYFTGELCLRAAKSVLEQYVDADVIIVDNSSDTEERRILETSVPDIKLLFPEKNLGFGKACNLAYRKIQADFILLLNPDAFLLKGCLESLLKFMDANPEAGAVSPRAFLDSTKTVFLPPIPRPDPLDFFLESLLRDGYRIWRSRHYSKKALGFWRAKTPLEQEMLSGGAVLLRKEAVESCGGLFDPRFFMYFEDADLCRRLRMMGWKLFLVPSALAVHMYDQSPGPDIKASSFRKSQRLYFQKHYPLIWPFLKMLRVSTPGVQGRQFLKLDGRPPLTLPTAGQLDGKWCFEFSPNPDIYPAGGVFGQGPVFSFSPEAWDALHTGDRYFFRFSPLQ